MAFNVRFVMEDEKKRETTRTWANTQATLALALTDIGVLAGFLNALSMGGLKKVVLTTTDISDAFAAIADSNVDKAATIKVRGGDARDYPVSLPMINSALVNAGGGVQTGDVAITNFFDEFAVGKNWRINLNNNTDVVSIVDGTLDT